MIPSSEAAGRCWSRFLVSLRQALEEEEVEAWASKLTLLSHSNQKVTLGGINQFFCNWIKSHHQDLLRNHLKASFQDLTEGFEIEIQPGRDQEDPNPKVLEAQETESQGLNPAYNFESFVNGEGTEIAYAAARAVGEAPKGNKYNPLFLCGDVGLGKTHLLQAIGLMARQNDPGCKICYASSKEFTNQVIDGIRFGRIQQVRNRYRQVDLLLIDDIQFLENKESTQEEFFHTFNELIQNNKQIVLTADRYPREIQKLEERLVNRFNQGMVARIFPPDFETRVAIIRNKVEQMDLPLGDDIINYVANVVKSNVRDIEGILVHIEASWSLLGQDISLETTKRVLKEVLNLEDNPLTIERIIKHVAARFSVKITDIKSDKRDKEISKTRQIAMYLAREITGLSFPVIAKHFGGKNHTSVMQACKKTKEWSDSDPEMKQTLQSLLREISQ